MGALDSATYASHMQELHANRVTMSGIQRGAVDNDAAPYFQAAMAKHKPARTAIPGAPLIVPPAPKVIDLPPGIYSIKAAQALLGAEDIGAQTSGVHYRGAGSGNTVVTFGASGAAVMAKSQYWQNVRFSGIKFVCTSAAAGSTFLWGDNPADTYAGQDFVFTDCAWDGPWKYIVDLTGVNNNSEYRFIACTAAGLQNDGAWIHTPALDSNGSDQFLNYWFYGCKFWSTSASIVDMASGGSVHLYGFDASDWGASNAGALIKLKGEGHARGVQQFHAAGLRVELKSATSLILDSEWPGGNVDIQCDITSQVEAFTYGNLFKIKTGNTSGASYHFHDSHMAGKIAIELASNSWTTDTSVVVSDSTWLQAKRPTDVVSWSGSPSGITPAVQFVRCRPEGYSSSVEAAGFATWDATVGWEADGTASALTKRAVRCRSVWGGTASGDTQLIHLPLNAVITDIQAFSAVEGASDADGGSFVVKTTEATPATVGQVTIAGSTSAGYNVTQTLAQPFRCSTAAKASVTITSTNVTSTPEHAQVLIWGYW